MAGFSFHCFICGEFVSGEADNCRELKLDHLMDNHEFSEVKKFHMAVDIVEGEYY